MINVHHGRPQGNVNVSLPYPLLENNIETVLKAPAADRDCGAVSLEEDAYCHLNGPWSELYTPELRVDEAFACQASTPYKLLSLVCYYGKHYACFVHDDKTGSWTYFDDSIVREIGNTWADVLTKCESGRWQPQLLVYHRPGGSGHSYAPAAAGVGAAAAAAASGRGGGQGGAAVAAENVVKYPSASASAAVAPGSTVPHIGPAA
eukprot:gene22626-32817_t